ncbi:LbtU family siderophore porin [uncultured Desulfosarcina sp.]|uniref:LbtU family siderophore porin n=1 Tax=uncultured Desulfosarcina sp. TaxID=218289 RepID=UPI0029C7880C|nr:LbtU family siderophore porin [uncultured Desulfosarcina sp.]
MRLFIEKGGTPNHTFTVGYTMESDGFTVDFGVSYINNLIDADAWEDIIDEEGLALNEYAAGMGAYAIVGVGQLTLIGEYVTALDEIEWIDDSGAAVNEDEIAAWNLEIAYAFTVGEKEAVLAAALQGTDEAQSRLPETRYMGSFGIAILEGTNLAFEYAHDEYENDDEEDALTAQLSIEF